MNLDKILIVLTGISALSSLIQVVVVLVIPTTTPTGVLLPVYAQSTAMEEAGENFSDAVEALRESGQFNEEADIGAPAFDEGTAPEEQEGVAEAAEENASETTSGATNETTASVRNNMTGIKLLAIQSAQSGTLSQINATAYTLELRNMSEKTILFSDRPDRIVTSQSTSDFIGNWTIGEDSFAIDPPNAVLVLDDEEEGRQQQDIAIITLFNAAYDSEADALRYDIIPENATTTATTSLSELPTEFGQSTLVIDDTSGIPSHTEGEATSASGDTSHAEGYGGGGCCFFSYLLYGQQYTLV